MVPGTGLLAACVPGTFETWMLLLRDYGTMRLADVLAPAIGYAQNGYPLVERAQRDHRHGGGPVPRALADARPRSICRAARCRRPARCSRNTTLADDLYAHPARGRERRRRPRRADRSGAQELVAGLRRRGDRPLLPHAGDDGHQRRAPSRRAHRRRHGALAGHASRRRSPTTTAATPSASPALVRRGR